jgi:hypothetical protein
MAGGEAKLVIYVSLRVCVFLDVSETNTDMCVSWCRCVCYDVYPIIAMCEYIYIYI